MNTVNPQQLEKLINNHPAISDVEVYKSLNGKVYCHTASFLSVLGLESS